MVGDSSSGPPGSPPVALTASQWLQLDVYGFVLIDGVLKRRGDQAHERCFVPSKDGA